MALMTYSLPVTKQLPQQARLELRTPHDHQMSLRQSHLPTSPNVRTLPLWSEKLPFGDTDHEPARQAFNDLAALTTRGHAWLAKTAEDRYLRLYDWGAWLVGMPKQAEVKPRRTAIAVMNAGEGEASVRPMSRAVRSLI